MNDPRLAYKRFLARTTESNGLTIRAKCVVAAGFTMLLAGCGVATPNAVAPSSAPTAGTVSTVATSVAPSTATSASQTRKSNSATASLVPAPTSAQPDANLLKITAAGVGGLNDIASYVALDKNFYAEQGLQVDLQVVANGVDVLPAVARDQIDFIRSSSNAALFNAIATGIPVKVVGTDLVVADPKSGQRSTVWMVVRRQLADQVKSVADLKGHTVAIAQIGTMGQSLLERVLQANQLQPSDVKLVELNYPDQAVGLANGVVDAAQMLEPYITAAESQDIGVRLYDEGNVLAGLPQEYVLYSPSISGARSDVGKRIAIAHLKADRYIAAALQPGASKSELDQILVAHTAIKDPQRWENILATSAVDPNGAVDTSWLEKDQEFFLRIGLVKTPVDLNTVVDQSFWRYAVQVVGQ